MKKIFFIGIFLGIVFIAAFLRLWHLSGVPISPNWDEVALGYNAFSILHTGRDEFGVFLPFVLKSFGNYTPALYAYLAIPCIMLFHLSVFSTRLPSAIMGIIAVITTYFLTFELLSLQSQQKTRNSIISLLSMFLLAISPWHIQFSRVAYEANPALTLCLLGLLFFLLGLKKPGWFIASAIFYGLSMHAYHSPRLFVPLFIVGLFVIFRKRLLEEKKYLMIPIIIGCIFLIPFVYYLVTGQSEQITGRFSETSIFTDTSNNVEQKDIAYYLFDSAIPQKAYTILTGYAIHFSPTWLFFTGDNDRHHAPSTGLLYLWEAPFLLLGLLKILSTKGKFRSVFFLWFLLAPVAASVTTELPHAVRTLIFLPSFQIATALGIEVFVFWIWKLSFFKKTIVIVPSLIIVIFCIFQYFHLYFYQMNHEVSPAWQFGYEHAVNYVEQNQAKYKKIVISVKLDQPYIFFLFYTRYDPASYLAAGGTKPDGIESFGKFTFRKLNWAKENHDETTLYVLSPIEPYSNEVHLIRYFDSEPAIRFAE